MISKIYGNNIANNTYSQKAKAENSPSFKGFAFFSCAGKSDYGHLIDLFSRQAQEKFGLNIVAKTAKKSQKAFFAVCPAKIDNSFEAFCQQFAKLNNLEFTFRTNREPSSIEAQTAQVPLTEVKKPNLLKQLLTRVLKA